MTNDEIKPMPVPGFPVGNVVPIQYAHLLRQLRLLRDIEQQLLEAFRLNPEMLTDQRDPK